MEGSTLEKWITERIAGRTGLPGSEIDPVAPLTSFGLSSLDAVVLVGDLQTHLRRTLPSTLVWEYPSISALVQHLEAPGRPDPREAEFEAPGAGEPIAIVGVGCRFPGADSPEAFWNLLAAGTDAVADGGRKCGSLAGSYGLLAPVRSM